MIDFDGRWATFYTSGHPLMLALGWLVGAPWLMPPLLGALSVVLMFIVGRNLFGATTGLLAAALLAMSPFFLMNASTFMSHNTAGFFLLASLAALTASKRNPIAMGLLGGLAFGMLFNTRPLSGAVLTLPFAGLILAPMLSARTRPRATRVAVAFAIGGGLMLIWYAFYNYSTTGSPLTNGYQAAGGLGDSVGFSGNNSIAGGLDNEVANLAAILLVMNGWPLFIGLAFAIAPFALGTRAPYDWFLLACGALVFASAAIFVAYSPVYGPRYVYEALPFFILLTARGADVTAARLGDAITALGDRTASQRDHLAAALPVYVLIVGVAIFASYSWVGGRNSWRLDGIPFSARAIWSDEDEMKFLDRVAAANPHHAIVVLQSCPYIFGGSCYENLFWRNAPTLDGDIVYVTDAGAEDARLFAAYPCRTIFYATYSPASITPGGATPAKTGETCS